MQERILWKLLQVVFQFSRRIAFDVHHSLQELLVQKMLEELGANSQPHQRVEVKESEYRVSYFLWTLGKGRSVNRNDVRIFLNLLNFALIVRVLRLSLSPLH